MYKESSTAFFCFVSGLAGRSVVPVELILAAIDPSAGTNFDLLNWKHSTRVWGVSGLDFQALVEPDSRTVSTATATDPVESMPVRSSTLPETWMTSWSLRKFSSSSV